MKLGLVRIVSERLVGVQYFESKFQRELGEELIIDGKKWNVGVIGEDRAEIIGVLNGFVSKQNSIVRKQNKRDNREVDSEFNKIMREAMNSIENNL
tara:strand:+ start:585 stop:872 length:288 start_codon:yes stop_codon:yes gene_type:complete